MEKELKLLRKIEKLISENTDQLLMEVVPSDCKCNHKTKKVFKCPAAFEISVMMRELGKLRNSN